MLGTAWWDGKRHGEPPVIKRQTFLSWVVVKSHFPPSMCWGHSDKQNGVFPALSQSIACRGGAGDRRANELVLIKPHKLPSTGGKEGQGHGVFSKEVRKISRCGEEPGWGWRQVNRLHSTPGFSNVGLIPGTPGSWAPRGVSPGELDIHTFEVSSCLLSVWRMD